VISALGDTFAVQKNGIIVLGDEFDEVPVSWGFDDLVYARVKAAGGAGVRRITTPRGAFDAYYRPRATLLLAENEKLPAIVRQVAGSAGCTRYLVIMRQSTGGNRRLSGIGVVSLREGFVQRTQVFALLTIQLFDGRTFETIGPAVSPKRVLAHLVDGMGPPSHAGDVDNSAFPASPADAASNTVLRDMARSLLTYRLDQALPTYFNTRE
jgi:hypothetical protein